MGIGKDKSLLTAATELRRQAEERLRTKTVELSPPRTEEAMQRLVYEFEVHQIELEMQNAALRQTREEMATVLEKYTDLYDLAPVGYFTLDRDGTISAVNLSGADLLRFKRDRLIGRRFGLYVADEARTIFADFLEKVFAGKAKEACEMTLLNDENHPLFVQLEAVAFGSGQECIVVVSDITERRRAAEVIERLNTDLAARAADLEEANRELEAFNYTVAHDLRNPLNVISSYCQVFKELCDDKIDDQCRRYIQETYDGTLRMNRLIEALLNFSRLGHVKTRREIVDLSSMAHEIAAELQLSAPQRRVTFHTADGISVDGDASLLRVVLDNLLGNAWKYTGTRDEGIIEFGTTEVDGKPAWFVRDNGAGFDMADADKLFTPFQRLPGAEECRGFGIGLATVERIIRRHGGKVWAEGEPGKGACFYFTLQP